MNMARCFKCGLKIPGRWKNGVPKSCPVCGFNGSAEMAKQAVKAKLEKIKNDPSRE
jgi:hypothetical protein